MAFGGISALVCIDCIKGQAEMAEGRLGIFQGPTQNTGTASPQEQPKGNHATQVRTVDPRLPNSECSSKACV